MVRRQTRLGARGVGEEDGDDVVVEWTMKRLAAERRRSRVPR